MVIVRLRIGVRISGRGRRWGHRRICRSGSEYTKVVGREKRRGVEMGMRGERVEVMGQVMT